MTLEPSPLTQQTQCRRAIAWCVCRAMPAPRTGSAPVDVYVIPKSSQSLYTILVSHWPLSTISPPLLAHCVAVFPSLLTARWRITLQRYSHTGQPAKGGKRRRRGKAVAVGNFGQRPLYTWKPVSGAISRAGSPPLIDPVHGRNAHVTFVTGIT
jgi:hypothetical protein